ncbi:MAG: DUF6355 family natural product biosynthesis protein [Pseudonocardiaceae bacterium]
MMKKMLSTGLSTVLLAGLVSLTAAGPAQAASVEESVPAGNSQAAAQCGFYRYNVQASQFAAYNHCGPTTVRIHVDVRGNGGANNFHLCVGPGNTQLPGAGPNYDNAYYIGGAGCREGQRGGHTPH